jgi:hypothetical protein
MPSKVNNFMLASILVNINCLGHHWPFNK